MSSVYVAEVTPFTRASDETHRHSAMRPWYGSVWHTQTLSPSWV